MARTRVAASAEPPEPNKRDNSQGTPSEQEVMHGKVSVNGRDMVSTFVDELRSSGRYGLIKNAILEFIDNSVAARDTGSDRATLITLLIGNNNVSVKDSFGSGMDRAGLDKFFTYGERHNTGLNNRGLGAKLAAEALGVSGRIYARAKGSDECLEVIVHDWAGLIERGEFDYRVVNPRESLYLKEPGVRVVISDLHSVDDLRAKTKDIIRILSEEYRPLLYVSDPGNSNADLGRTVFDNDGKPCVIRDGVIIKVSRSKQRTGAMYGGVNDGKGVIAVQRMDMPLDLEYSTLGYNESNVRIVKTNDGKVIWYWIGVKDQKHPDAKALTRKGIRCYLDGKLIKVTSFGYDLSSSGMSGLIGEVHLDNMPEIRNLLSASKTSEFDDASDLWKDKIVPIMRKELEPLVRLMESNDRAKMRKPTPEEDKKICEDANRLLNLAMANLIANGDLAEDELWMFRSDYAGHKRRQTGNPDEEDHTTVFCPLPPQIEVEQEDTGITDPTNKEEGNKKGTKWKDQEPITPLPKDLDERYKRKRLSVAGAALIKPLEDPNIVSEFREGFGLIINEENMAVLQARAQGRAALMMLVAEQKCYHAAKNYTSSLSETSELTVEELLAAQNQKYQLLRSSVGNAFSTTDEFVSIGVDNYLGEGLKRNRRS